MKDLAFIDGHIEKLRKSEVKVAEYIRAHAGEVIHFSISELADNAGVSEPTVIRFCRALGFKGYQDFKIFLAQAQITPLRTIHQAMDGTEATPELVRKVFDSNIEAIRSTLTTLDFAVVERVVEILAASSKIVFHGLAGSAVVAMDAYHKFFRIGIPCEWFNDPHMAIMSAALLGPGQTFVAISHSGSSIDVVKALETAAEAGAETVAVTSHSKSPVSNAARHSLIVASVETQFKFEPMSSRIAQLSVIDVLSVGVALTLSNVTLSNLNKTRRALVSKRY